MVTSSLAHVRFRPLPDAARGSEASYPLAYGRTSGSEHTGKKIYISEWATGRHSLAAHWWTAIPDKVLIGKTSKSAATSETISFYWHTSPGLPDATLRAMP